MNLSEAFLKNNNIGAIKSLKMMSFKCKNNLKQCSRQMMDRIHF